VAAMDITLFVGFSIIWVIIYLVIVNLFGRSSFFGLIDRYEVIKSSKRITNGTHTTNANHSNGNGHSNGSSNGSSHGSSNGENGKESNKKLVRPKFGAASRGNTHSTYYYHTHVTFAPIICVGVGVDGDSNGYGSFINYSTNGYL
jgi:hypothetical protein